MPSFSPDFSQFYNLWQLIWLCLAALINCRLTWQLNSSRLPHPPHTDLMIIDCAMSPSPLPSPSPSSSCLWQTIKAIGPSATSSQGNCNRSDNDRVIALNPSIKRGHHDIVAPPAAQVARPGRCPGCQAARLPLLPKKTKNKKTVSKLAALIVDNISNNIQICQLPS